MIRNVATVVLSVVAGILVGCAATSPAPAAGEGNLGLIRAPGLADCFGHNGVQLGDFDAYLCETKLGGDPSGGFYLVKNLDNGVNEANPDGQVFWMKLHPAENNFYVWENYTMPWGGQPGDVRSNGRIIGIDEGEHLGQCIVVLPSWSADPTQCFYVRNGGHTVLPPHVMSAQELSSVLEYMKNARAAMPLSAR